jgi:branched-subunit amino acid transport protein
VALRIFAFAVPAILYGLYFAGMIVNDGGIGWSVHLWAGSAVMAGLVGVLLSYLVVPPQLPSEEAAAAG